MTQLMKRTTSAFVLVVCLPLVPVCILYLLFGQQNYFSLDGWAKGVLVAGPIAAYVYCLHFGHRMFRSLFHLQDSVISSFPEDILGIWEVRSSTLQTRAQNQSSLTISEARGAVYVSGAIHAENGAENGMLQSELCHFDPNQDLLTIVYKTRTFHGESGAQGNDFICFLKVNDERNLMVGNWYQIGDSKYSGTVEFAKRVKSNIAPTLGPRN